MATDKPNLNILDFGKPEKSNSIIKVIGVGGPPCTVFSTHYSKRMNYGNSISKSIYANKPDNQGHLHAQGQGRRL